MSGTAARGNSVVSILIVFDGQKIACITRKTHPYKVRFRDLVFATRISCDAPSLVIMDSNLPGTNTHKKLLTISDQSYVDGSCGPMEIIAANCAPNFHEVYYGKLTEALCSILQSAGSSISTPQIMAHMYKVVHSQSVTDLIEVFNFRDTSSYSCLLRKQ